MVVDDLAVSSVSVLLPLPRRTMVRKRRKSKCCIPPGPVILHPSIIAFMLFISSSNKESVVEK
jgi:hypothetical protein